MPLALCALLSVASAFSSLPEPLPPTAVDLFFGNGHDTYTSVLYSPTDSVNDKTEQLLHGNSDGGNRNSEEEFHGGQPIVLMSGMGNTRAALTCSVSVGDVDGDGIDDLVFANGCSSGTEQEYTVLNTVQSGEVRFWLFLIGINLKKGDASAYIPTNVISTTDGQIFLESQRSIPGIWPAINVGVSVSRAGSVAQLKGMKQVSGTLKLGFQLYREPNGSDVDAATQEFVNRRARLLEVLKQNESVVLFQERVVGIYAVLSGSLDAVNVSDVDRYQKLLLTYTKTNYPGIFDAIDEAGVLTPELGSWLNEMITKFTAEFIA